jgi:ABC-type antimicrobial peptide transport system permease subunit
MKLTALGLVIGLLGAFGVTRVIASLLFGVSPTDPMTFGGIFVVLAAVAFAASYMPARRATRVDPVTALREQ